MAAVGAVIGGAFGVAGGLISHDAGRQLLNDAVAGFAAATEGGRETVNSSECGEVKLSPASILAAAVFSGFGDGIGAGSGASIEAELVYAGTSKEGAHQGMFGTLQVVGGVPGLAWSWTGW